MCTMMQDSCSYTQRDGKDCGNYPTCVRNPHASSGSSGKWGTSKGWETKSEREHAVAVDYVGYYMYEVYSFRQYTFS